ncbi:hypothetical protein HPB47_002658, partial [Ixodes persulcatus]
RQFNGDGRLQEWWEKETLYTFQAKYKCFIEQYGNKYVPEVNMNVNGNLTLGENMADNMGLLIAHKAFERLQGAYERLPGLQHMTAEKLFFISQAM